MRYKLCCTAVLTCSLSSFVMASVVEFHDRAEWEAAVGSFTTIDFVLPPSSTPITDQYSDQGVSFSGITFSHASGSYLNDGWGLRSVGGAWVHFESPQRWVGFDHPGHLMFDLYSDGTLIHTSSTFGSGGSGFFGGLISDVPFDEMYLYKPEPLQNHVHIDDMHFGIPAPGALGLLALAGFFGSRRRRE